MWLPATCPFGDAKRGQWDPRGGSHARRTIRSSAGPSRKRLLAVLNQLRLRSARLLRGHAPRRRCAFLAKLPALLGYAFLPARMSGVVEALLGSSVELCFNDDEFAVRNYRAWAGHVEGTIVVTERTPLQSAQPDNGRALCWVQRAPP
jgi:hypothetical protein